MLSAPGVTAQGAAPSAAPAAAPPALLITPASGVYSSDQRLVAEASGPGLEIRYSFRDASGAEGPWIPLRAPLVLSAAPGEQRDYRLIVRADSAGAERERHELTFRIDKRLPPAPVVLPQAGTYWDPVAVRFSASAQDTVYYSVQGDVVRGGTAWDGRDVTVGSPDADGQFVVQAYSVSQSGMRSRIVTARYRVDARAPVLDVLSPVAGTFANAQALAVTFRDIAWVRYTLDGSDPGAGGIPYTGPVTIDRQGTTRVRIAAQPRSASRPLIRRDIDFTYTPAQGTGLRLDTPSGSYPNGISPQVLSSPGGSLYCALWEKTPTESDQLVSSGIAVSAQTGGPSPVVVRLRALSLSGTWGPEYRYFYFVGKGGPVGPSASMGGDGISGPARIQVTAPEDALMSVTADGSSPNPRVPSTSTWVDVPAGVPATIHALAFDGSGALSATMEVKTSSSPVLGAAPVVSFGPGPVAGTGVLSVAAGDKAAAYEMTSDGSDPAAPGRDSPRLAQPLTVSVPFGTRRTFKVRVALVDGTGTPLTAPALASFAVDRTPPPQPQLVPGPGTLDEPTSLPFGTGSRVFFSLTSDGTTPPDPDPRSSPSNAFVALPGVPGTVVTYRLKLLASDASGNSTEVYGPFIYTVDLRAPVIPPLKGISDGARYNTRQVSPVIGESAWAIRYTATSDGSEPAEPDLQSPLLTDSTVFAGEVGAQTLWRLKLLAISHGGKRVGEEKSLSFVIDLKPPEVPKLLGIPDSGRVARPVVLTAEPVPPDVHVVYSLTSDGSDPADPATGGTELPVPLTLDVPDGTRHDFAIRIATVDEAGNRSLYNRLYGFTIDRELPEDPVVQGAADGSVTDRPLTLMLASREPSVVYELTDDGSLPRLPSPSSAAYSGPLLLAGKPGASVTYRLLARAFNDLGTASRAAHVFAVTIDRTDPVAPGAPSVQFDPANPAVAYLAWPLPPSGRILYKLAGASDAAGADYVAYTGPVSLAVDPDHGSVIAGSSVYENPGGARSPASAFSLSVGRRLLPPVFNGARDGAMSTRRIELRAGAPDGEVRYEVATDGSYPPTVTAASPLFPGSLVLDAADGQTVEVRIAARAFDPAGKSIPSDAVTISVAIDRTPPDPPVATGVEDGGHYQDDRTVKLLSAEGDIYDVVSTSPDPVIPAQMDADRYSAPLVLSAPTGQSLTYHIVAFSVDPAGNRSREIRSWTVTIDKKIVYAASTGNDYADGSRDAPVRSIGKALEIAAATGRRAVFAAAGDYSESSSLQLSGDMTLTGGLDPESWQPLGLERYSTISAAQPWKSGASLVAVTAGSVRIQGFDFRGGPGPVSVLVSLTGGTLSVEQASVSLRGPGEGQGISVTGGALSLSNCALSASPSWKGSFIFARGGTVSVSGSRFEGPRTTEDFAALDVDGVHTVSLKGVSIDPGSGQRTRGIRSSSSELSMSGSRVSSGAGSVEAVAIDARDSSVTLDNADVVTPPQAFSPAGVLAVGGSLQVSRSRFTVEGTASAVGVSARGADVVLLRSRIRATATREYLSLVRLEDGRALVADSVLVGARAGQAVAIQVKGGPADLLNNTIVAGDGTTFSAGVLVMGDRLPRLVNNILTRQGRDQGTAIAVLDARTVFAGGSAGDAAVLISNAFGGWKSVLHADYARDTGRAPLDVATAGALNARDANLAAGPITGNVAEPASVSFPTGQTDAFRLSRSSVCVEGGVDLAASGGPGGTGDILLKKASEVSADFLGNPRPGPVPLAVPGPPRGWDIGAYEYTE